MYSFNISEPNYKSDKVYLQVEAGESWIFLRDIHLFVCACVCVCVCMCVLKPHCGDLLRTSVLVQLSSDFFCSTYF